MKLRIQTAAHPALGMYLWGMFSAAVLFVTAAPAQTETYGQPPTPQVVSYVVQALQAGDLPDAAALVVQYRRLHGDTPEALYALAWLARGQAAMGHAAEAQQATEEIESAVRKSLSTRKLDAEPYLPLALGSAYEVQADLLARDGKRTEALQLLRSAMAEWRGTPLVDRMQKNINLLTLQGKPAPVLRQMDWIGRKPAAPTSLRGHDTLLFFWAHWCADCKAESPVIARIAGDFEPKGLVVIAPTRLYGYTAQDEHAPAVEERAFVTKVFDHYYGGIPNASAPLDTGNFTRFGVSTTPTIVLVDKRGIVQLYHPGVMDEAALRSAVERLLAPLSAGRNASQPGR